MMPNFDTYADLFEIGYANTSQIWLSMMQNFTTPQVVVTMLVTLAGMTMGQIGMTHIFVWLYHQTNSIFLSSLFHAFNNLFGIWPGSFLVEPQAVSL